MEQKRKTQAAFPYEDIVDLPHHVSASRKPMSRIDRAAQFASFSALNGHEEAVEKTAEKAKERMEFRDVEQIDEV